MSGRQVWSDVCIAVAIALPTAYIPDIAPRSDQQVEIARDRSASALAEVRTERPRGEMRFG